MLDVTGNDCLRILADNCGVALLPPHTRYIHVCRRLYLYAIQSTVIKSFAHKGLGRFFLTGSKAGIQPAHADKLARQLAILNVAKDAKDMDKPGWKLHRLLGRDAGRWSVWVSGNWRLTFRFSGEDAEVVDYQDYH